MNSPPQGVICPAEEYLRSLRNTSLHCLTRAESIGLTIGTEAGILSFVAILYVVFLVVRKVVWRCRHVKKAKLQIFHQPMDLLMFSLLFADTLQAIGGALNVKWINNGKVEVGTFCTVQGIVQTIGQSGVALTTLAITIYTFVGMWMLKDVSSKKIALWVLSAIWLFIAGIVAAGNMNIFSKTQGQESSVPTPYWCWINKKPVEWRLYGLYVWIWLSLFSSMIIYLPLYLLMRGNIAVDEQKWWKFRFQRAKEGDPELARMRRQSFIMLVYPLAYSIVFLPVSLVRWLSVAESPADAYITHLPVSIMFAASSLFGLSGLVNVVLLLTTKPTSGLFGELMSKQPAKPLIPVASPVVPDRLHHHPDRELSEATTILVTVSPPTPPSESNVRCRDCGKKVKTNSNVPTMREP